MTGVQQKSEWLIEWENSGSTLSFANWMIGKAEALEAKLSKMEEAVVRAFREHDPETAILFEDDEIIDAALEASAGGGDE